MNEPAISLAAPRAETATQPTLSLREISKHFDAIAALTDVSFEVLPGEVHALLGENGAGKSTLMAVASGAISPLRALNEMFSKPWPLKPSTRNSGASSVASVYFGGNVASSVRPMIMARRSASEISATAAVPRSLPSRKTVTRSAISRTSASLCVM